MKNGTSFIMVEKIDLHCWRQRGMDHDPLSDHSPFSCCQMFFWTLLRPTSARKTGPGFFFFFFLKWHAFTYESCEWWGSDVDELKQEMEFISQDENKVSSFITDGGFISQREGTARDLTAEVSKVNVDHHPSQSNKKKIWSVCTKCIEIPVSSLRWIKNF